MKLIKLLLILLSYAFSLVHFRFEIISIGAKKEKQLKENLAKILAEWCDIIFTVSKWKQVAPLL
jgi:hypothetical protein